MDDQAIIRIALSRPFLVHRYRYSHDKLRKQTRRLERKKLLERDHEHSTETEMAYRGVKV